jgi:hypothetical protein
MFIADAAELKSNDLKLLTGDQSALVVRGVLDPASRQDSILLSDNGSQWVRNGHCTQPRPPGKGRQE